MALARIAAGDVPLAPVHAAVHARLQSIAPGRATAVMPVPDEGVDAALWLLADFVSGVAVTATLAPGRRITTLRLTLHVLARDVTGELHALGFLDERIEHVALSTALISDDAGRIVARATGRNAVLADDVAAAGWATAPEWAPVPRSVASLVVDGAVPDPAAVNTASVVQGGALAAVAARALADVLGGPPDEATATFLRAVPADGRAVHADAGIEHDGRRLRSGHAALRSGRDQKGDRLALTLTGLRYTPG